MEPLCCGKPMRAMGQWPKTTIQYRWSEGTTGDLLKCDDSTTIIGDKYHCLECNKYTTVLED